MQRGGRNCAPQLEIAKYFGIKTSFSPWKVMTRFRIGGTSGYSQSGIPSERLPSLYHSECLSRKRLRKFEMFVENYQKSPGLHEILKIEIKHCFSQALHHSQTLGSVTFCWMSYSTFWKLIIYPALIFLEKKTMNNGRQDRGEEECQTAASNFFWVSNFL